MNTLFNIRLAFGTEQILSIESRMLLAQSLYLTLLVLA